MTADRPIHIPAVRDPETRAADRDRVLLLRAMERGILVRRGVTLLRRSLHGRRSLP